MCSLYYIDPDDMHEQVLEIIEAINRAKLNKHAGPHIAPTDFAPVIIPGQILPMQWGFTSPGRKAPVINARCETAAEKNMFAASLQYRRCLLPASGYYEWDQHRRKYAIHSHEPIYMAGIFRPEDDRATRFCIMTRPPVSALAAIHDRMPVILPSDAARGWLQGTLSPADAASFTLTELTPHTDAVQLSFFDSGSYHCG